MSIVTLSASPSPASRSARLAEHVNAQLARRAIAAQHIRIAGLPAEALLNADTRHPAVARSVEAVAEAAGIVIVTPIYKASYSGILKTFLDLLPQFALSDKVVLPLATGGSLAHVLALDYALRPVLQSLGAHHVVQGYFVLDSWFGGDDEPIADARARSDLACAVDAFARSLAFDAVAEAAV
ncbi:NADPH-dependent FMN reductase [Amorphus sp. MBR-141]